MSHDRAMASPPAAELDLRSDRHGGRRLVPSSGSSPWVRRIVVVVVVGIVGMWVYIFAWDLSGRGKPLDRISDRQWSAAAEQVCSGYRAQVLALPQARTFADKTPQDRAVVLDEANGLLTSMVAALRALPFNATGHQADLRQAWLGDWDTFLQNRRDYSVQLHAGDGSEFGVSQVEGVPINARMDTFSDVNGMGSCKDPGDV
jgi:hypothetical protein